MKGIEISAFNFKKIFITFILFFLLGSPFLIFYLKTGLLLKILLIFAIFIFFISFLTLFEAVNSLATNLLFWLIPSLFFSYFYLWSGLIIFLLAFLKLILENNLMNSSVKIPFYQLISQNFHFLFLTLIVILSLFIFQELNQKTNFPLSFENYEKIFNFLFQRANLNQYFQNLLKTQLQNKGLVFKQEQIDKQLEILQKETKKNIYDFLSQIWQNQKIFIILGLIFLAISIIYPILSFLIPILSLVVLLLIYIYQALGLFKINYKDVKKEFIEI